jgi:hypothetical protein
MLVTLLLRPSPSPACSLCDPNAQGGLSLRQDLAQAKLVLFGSLANSRLLPAGGGGTTDLQIERVLKNNPILGDKKVMTIGRYVPVVDPKNPPRFLVFCDVFNGKVDAYRGLPVKSAAVVDYLKGAADLNPRDPARALQYFFGFLDHPEPEISNDAFLEFAKAGDADVGQVASKLSAAKLRSWMQDPKTPVNRLSLYAFLLGACGGKEDAAVLRDMIDRPNERTLRHLSGILAGYIQLQPEEGWRKAHALLADSKRSFPERFAVLGTLRFYQGWKPAEYRPQIVRGLLFLLGQPDMADLAIEDLRKFQIWDLTAEVIKLWGKPGYDAPIMRRTIVRYLLTCPRPEARRLVEEIRKKEPDLIKDMEEQLRPDKK